MLPGPTAGMVLSVPAQQQVLQEHSHVVRQPLMQVSAICDSRQPSVFSEFSPHTVGGANNGATTTDGLIEMDESDHFR